MNKKDLRLLPMTDFGMVVCNNCGMKKWTSTIVGMNSNLAMTTQITKESHCCDSPYYTWWWK